LLGAQLAASHQHEKDIHQELRARHVDQELRETLAIGIATLTAARYLAAQPPITQSELVRQLQAPAPTIEEVLAALVKGNILVRAVAGEELGHVPGRDVDSLRLSDIKDAVRTDAGADELKQGVRNQLDPRLVELMEQTEHEAIGSARNITLRKLASLAGVAAEPPLPPGATEPAEIVIDGKQPGVG
jgi:DNA-binding IscR family transcriptional regulator